MTDSSSTPPQRTDDLPPEGGPIDPNELYWYWQGNGNATARRHYKCPSPGADGEDGIIWSDDYENLTCMDCGMFEAGPESLQPTGPVSPA